MLEDGQEIEDIDLRKHVTRYSLFLRLCDLCGLRFSFAKNTEEYIIELLNLEKPFQLENLFQLEPKVKHIHRISFEEGTALCKYALTKSGS